MRRRAIATFGLVGALAAILTAAIQTEVFPGKVRIASTATDALCVGSSGGASPTCTGGIAAGPITGTVLNATTGYRIAGAASSGTFLRGNGTNYLASVLTLPNAANAGDLLVASGSNAIGAQAPAALTRTNDTNVTATLGGAASTALVNAASITLGWTGQLAPARGGTGLDTSGSTGLARVNAGTWAVDQIFATAATTGVGYTFSADGLSTGGNTLLVSGSTVGSRAGGILKVSGILSSGLTGNPPAARGLYSTIDARASSALGSTVNGYFFTDVSSTSNAAEVFGLYSRMTDTSGQNNVLHGIDIDITASAGASTIYALSGTATVASNSAGSTLNGLLYGVTNSGAPTTGTQTTSGAIITAGSTGVNGATANVTGVDVTADGTVASGTINAIGVRVRNGTMNTTGTSKQIGIQIDALSGADTNYALITNGGNVGISNASPTRVLDVTGTFAASGNSWIEGNLGVGLAGGAASAPFHLLRSSSGSVGLLSSTGEAQLTIQSDTTGTGSDLDVLIRFTYGAGAGVLKAFAGYDKGADKALFGYNGVATFGVDSSGNGYLTGSLVTTTPTGTLGLIFGDGTPLSSMVTNTAGLYADDVGGTVNMFAINEAGDVARLTGTIARNSSQFDKAASTTLADVTGLSLPTQAGKTYAFTGKAYVTASSAGGVKLTMGGTTTATAIVYAVRCLDEATNTYAIVSTQTALGGSGVAASGPTSLYCAIDGTIVVNAAGSLTMQFAQFAASGTSSVRANSTLEFQQVQ